MIKQPKDFFDESNEGHGLAKDDKAWFCGGTLPTGFTEGTEYSVVGADHDSFKVSAAQGGPSIYRTVRRVIIGALLVIAILVMSFQPAKASDEVSLYVGGVSYHFADSNGRKRTGLNESNPGLTLEYAWDHGSGLFWTVAAGAYRDSYLDITSFAGPGVKQRFYVTDGFRIDAGMIVFLMRRPSYRDGNPFLGALPSLSFGTPKAAANLIYAPRIGKNDVPVILLQMQLVF